MASLTRLSPAKINLTLRVTGLRPDGFHEIESLVALVTLHDSITVVRRADGKQVLQCDDPRLPCDERNLALRAAAELAKECGVTGGFELVLQKRIPMGAGLGGGSSNAATTLLLLDELWGLHLSRERLTQIGARVGSDVPLFLNGAVSIIRGRGEEVEPVEVPLAGCVLLLMPDLHSATADVYRAWDSLAVHPPRTELSEVLTRVHQPAEFSRVLFNDLEEAALQVQPELGRLAGELRRILACPVHMTGSGAAFFCVLERTEARKAADDIRAAGLAVRVEQVDFVASKGRATQ